MTTDNSRADALTDALMTVLEKADTSERHRTNQAWIDLRTAIDACRAILVAPPVEQPAAAPIDESGANECSIDFGPGATLKPGPRVTFADGMREAARLIQLWQSMQPAYRQLHSAYNRDASRIIAFWPGRLREAADDTVVEQPAPSPADERAAEELDALAPCPFCCGKAMECGAAHPMGTWAQCEQCGARTRQYDRRDKTIAAWNQRQARAASANETGAEPVAWCVTWPGDPKETWCSVFVNERDAIQSASHHDNAEIVPLYAAPQHPAQADARVGLTDEQREAIQRAVDYADMSDRDSDAEALRALLQGANYAE